MRVAFEALLLLKVDKLYTFSNISTQLFKRNVYKIIVKTNFNLRYINCLLIFESINF